MEVECCTHEASERMKLALFDLKKSKCELIVSNPNYILRKTKLGAQLLLFDQQFQNLIKTIEIYPIFSLKCFALIDRRYQRNALFCCGQTITMIYISPSGQPTRRQNVLINMQASDQFIMLSNELKLKDYSAFIAYTKHHQFYLIVVKKLGIFEVIKISNAKDIWNNHGLIQWFSRTKSQLSHINMQLFRIDQYQRFVKLLLVRDKQVTMHLIELNLHRNQCRIILVDQAIGLHQLLPSNSNVTQSLIKYQQQPQFRQMEVFMAIDINHNFIDIIKIKIDCLDSKLFRCSRLLQSLQRDCFSMTLFNDSLFYSSYNAEKQRYQLFKNKLCWLQQNYGLMLQDSNPALVFEEKPIFASFPERLFIIDQKQILLLGREEEVSDFSDQQRKWFDFKDTLNHIYFKKIAQLQKSDFSQLLSILTEKERKVYQWFDQQTIISEEESGVKQILGIQIVIIVICKELISYIRRNQILNSSQFKSICFQQIFSTAASCLASEMIDLLNDLIRQKQYQCFLEITKKINLLSKESYYRQSVKAIFEEPLDFLAKESIAQNIEVKMYEQIILELSSFKIVEKIHLQFLEKQECFESIKYLIITKNLEELFVSYFMIEERQIFSYQDLKKFASSLKKQGQKTVKQFATQLLIKCRQKNEANSKFIFKRLSILIEGLLPIHDLIFQEIDNFLPGLNIFLLMRRKKREKIVELLQSNSYFQELPNKNFLYMLVFDILDKKIQEGDISQLLYEVLFTNQDMISSIQRGNKRIKQNKLSEDLQFLKFQSLPKKRIKM